MGTGIFLIVLCIAIYGAVYWNMARIKKEGKIIDRGKRFYEEGEEFTISADNNTVVQKIKSLPYSDMKVSMNCSGQSFGFSTMFFSAQLLFKGTSDGKSVYEFSFTSWREKNGGAMDFIHMNMLITSIEKAFLSIDPNTQVRTWKIDFNRKTSFF